MVPESQLVFPGRFTPNAPADMVSGVGKNGRYVCVVPSEGVVMVRIGEDPSSVPVPFLFLDDIWEKLAPIIRQGGSVCLLAGRDRRQGSGRTDRALAQEDRVIANNEGS